MPLCLHLYLLRTQAYILPITSPMLYHCATTPPSSSSCIRVMNHNWSATKQRIHPQSAVAIQISRHSVLSGDRIQQCETSSGSRHKDCKSPFPSTGTAVSLFRAKTVQQRPLLLREVETQLPDCGFHTR